MKKAILMAAALILAPLPTLSQEGQRSEGRTNVERSGDRDARGERPSEFEFRDRFAGATETIEGACAADINNFCGKVTPGAGRLVFCMRAHEDQFSRDIAASSCAAAISVFSGH